MYLDYIEGNNKDAITFLIEKIGDREGADKFILAVKEGLNLSGEKLVWWIDIFNKYHQHDDYSYSNILKTRRHFRNIAFTYLDSCNYKMFHLWIKNWSNTLVVCRHAFPEKWSIRNLEDIR